MGVTYFLLLSSLGLAVTVQAQNCSIPVPGPNMNLKDKYINQQTFTDGTKVYFSCDVGYMSAGGSTAITCSAGSWSPVTLKCERKNCGSAGEVTNGHVDYPEGIQFGDKAVITCDTGYRLVGKREITCGDGGWMGRLPECEVVKCSPPPEAENGFFNPNHEDPYSYGDVVLYSCNKDYSLNGSKSRTCSEDGTFRPDPPTCIKVECEDPHVVSGYWFEGSRPPYRLSSTVTFKCDSGYIMKGEGTQTCDISSKWSPGLPTCEPKNCSRPVPGPNMKLKDTDILLQIFLHGTKVSFSCDVGYMSAGGSAAITCSAGSWSPVTLKCERKSCGSAGEVTNGHVDYPEGIQFGDKAVITCDTGYRLVGNREITCGDRGWMGRLPECEVVKCSPPPEVENGVFSPNNNSYVYGDVVLYSCDRGFTVNGSKSRTCSEDGTFRPDPPTCIKVECEDPHVVNGYWFEGSRPPYRLSSTVTFKCDSGYIMKGERTQTCDISSKWSPGLPTCERSLVPPITTATTTTTTDSTPKDGGTSQHWTCVGALVGVLVIIAVCLTGFFIFKKRQRSRRSSSNKEATKDEAERVALS